METLQALTASDLALLTPSEIIVEGRDHPALRTKASPIAPDAFASPALTRLVHWAQRVLARHANGAALAAVQIALPVRFFVVAPEVAAPARAPLVYLNPTILTLPPDRVDMEEGCLSLPGLRGVVPRAPWVELQAQSLTGEVFRLRAEGLLAQVFQHETDHLDGILFIDRAQRVWEQGAATPSLQQA